MAIEQRGLRLSYYVLGVALALVAPWADACEGQEVTVLFDGGVVGKGFHGADLAKRYDLEVIPSTGREQKGAQMLNVLKHLEGDAKQVTVRDCRGGEELLIVSAAVEAGEKSIESYYLAKNKHGDVKLVWALGEDVKARSVLKGVCELDVRSMLMSPVRKAGND